MNKVDRGYCGFRNEIVRKALSNKGTLGLNGLSIEIDYGIYNKIDTAGKIKYYKVNEKTGIQDKFEDTNCSKYDCIEYTDERYQFFQEIEESMKTLVDRLANFFGSDSDEIVKMIDNKIKLISNETSQNQ
jgi:hypothetical protein